MRITVRLFARARELGGTDVLSVDVPESTTVRELKGRIASEHPALAALLSRSAIGLNGEFASEDVQVRPNAEVAVLPPVSGG